ncbi:acyl-CoA carboxylase subunit epsilon [Streptomyces sp. NPDC021093]|uniref:acyl-CoA carboxylase subunit epsilon n=1 Tax=Streptomyces sp. NPDC021093 TaxID=3365112 RepID=UPI0037BE1247
MSSAASAGAVVRVERGEASEEELAAVVALFSLLAQRRTSTSAAGEAVRPRARWRRPERTVGYHAPYSWR